MRKPISAASFIYGDSNQFHELFVVCDDGAVFGSDTDGWQLRWIECAPVPGSEAEREREQVQQVRQS